MPLINVDVPERHPHSWEYFTRNGADGPWDFHVQLSLEPKVTPSKIGYVYIMLGRDYDKVLMALGGGPRLCRQSIKLERRR